MLLLPRRSLGVDHAWTGAPCFRRRATHSRASLCLTPAPPVSAVDATMASCLDRWNDLENLQEGGEGKGIGDNWESTSKDPRTQGWHFAAGGLKRMIQLFVSGEMPNRGIIVRALGTRQESFDVITAITLRVRYQDLTPCPRPARWCTHAGSEYRQVDCQSNGILDHVCTDQRHAWLVRSAGECASEGPDADLELLCPELGGERVPPPPTFGKVDGRFSTGFQRDQPDFGWSYWTNSESGLGDWHK